MQEQHYVVHDNENDDNINDGGKLEFFTFSLVLSQLPCVNELFHLNIYRIYPNNINDVCGYGFY
jgi:hypothetical protein